MHRRLEVGHVFFGVQIAQAVLLSPVARSKWRGAREEGGTYQTNQTNTPRTISPTKPPSAPPTIGPSGTSELPLLSPLLPPVALAPLLVKKLVEVYVTYVVAPSGRVEADWEVITVALVPGEVGAIVVVVVVELLVVPTVGHVEKRVAVGEEVVTGIWRTTWDSIVLVVSAGRKRQLEAQTRQITACAQWKMRWV